MMLLRGGGPIGEDISNPTGHDQRSTRAALPGDSGSGDAAAVASPSLLGGPVLRMDAPPSLEGGLSFLRLDALPFPPITSVTRVEQSLHEQLQTNEQPPHGKTPNFSGVNPLETPVPSAPMTSSSSLQQAIRLLHWGGEIGQHLCDMPLQAEAWDVLAAVYQALQRFQETEQQQQQQQQEGEQSTEEQSDQEPPVTDNVDNGMAVVEDRQRDARGASKAPCGEQDANSPSTYADLVAAAGRSETQIDNAKVLSEQWPETLQSAGYRAHMLRQFQINRAVTVWGDIET